MLVLSLFPGLGLLDRAFEFEYAITASRGTVAGLKYDRGHSRPKSTIAKYKAAAKRPWAQLCELQGLPLDFLDNAPFTVEGKRRALGNGVPIPMGREIARAIKRALEIA
ncbi:MAG: hypothetical protein A2Z04_06705 [Chloroflexi bacterium RBG_16_57_9]|nr:MAG: hypothetical protein A2Z04_06705 [Chloroflexi bacterium RBG_16_57_9]